MNIGKALEESVKKYGDKIAIIYEDVKLSFKETDRLTNNLANGLKEKGVKKGDLVAISLPNNWENVIALYAVYKLGAVLVPIMPGPDEGVIRQLNDCQLATIITDLGQQKRFEQIKKDVSSLKNIIIASESLKKEAEKIAPAEIDEEDTSILEYTSGTTGEAKGTVFPFRSNDSSLAVAERCGMDENSVYLNVTPLFHIRSLVPLNLPVTCGAAFVILEIIPFDPRKWLEGIEKNKVTHTIIGTDFAYKVMELNEFDKYDLSSLKWVCVGGAYTPPEFMEAFGRACGLGRPAYGGAGTSELTYTCLEPIGAKYKPGTNGPPLKGVKIKIIDREGNELPPGQIGMTLIHSPFLMKGYYKNPELTAKKVKDGWLYTDDLGMLDEDGYYYIRGKMFDAIYVSNQLVIATKVETIINTNPKVKESAVIGIPDEKTGEKVKAFVVLKEGQEAKDEEIIQFCKQKMAGFEIPQIIEFRKEELPKARIDGKIAKWQLR